MLQGVDALFDNGRRGRPVADRVATAQESLGHVEGKQGRSSEPARQARRLLGPFGHRRRSQLKLHQCGLPKMMVWNVQPSS